MDSSRNSKQRKRRSHDARDVVSEVLAKWRNEDGPEDNPEGKQKRRRKGSKRGCMRGKGGPENSACKYRGVRQRVWGKWVAEIRKPASNDAENNRKGSGRLWLGTFNSAIEAAHAYDEAARVFYGSSAILNFPDHSGPETMGSSSYSSAAAANMKFLKTESIDFQEEFRHEAPELTFFEVNQLPAAKDAMEEEMIEQEDGKTALRFSLSFNMSPRADWQDGLLKSMDAEALEISEVVSTHRQSSELISSSFMLSDTHHQEQLGYSDVDDLIDLISFDEDTEDLIKALFTEL